MGSSYVKEHLNLQAPSSHLQHLIFLFIRLLRWGDIASLWHIASDGPTIASQNDR